MRLWTLHPSYLDAAGLVALWRVGARLTRARLTRARLTRARTDPCLPDWSVLSNRSTPERLPSVRSR